jgi:diguanylate cyclase (GGDEF)-like protein/PAS domain S-box-containing protein
LHNLLDNASVATFLVDGSGDVVYANAAFGELIGYTPEECLTLGIDTIVHRDETPTVRDQFARLLSGEIPRYSVERRYLHKSGAAVWVLVSSTLVRSRDGRILYTCVQAVDIDRQKRVEAALAESERRWGFALESAEQGVWECDIPADTVFYSRTWKKLRGFDPHQQVDSSQEEWLKRVHPDDRERIRETISKQNTGELKRNAFEYRERRQDGQYIWILSKGAPVAWDELGRPTRMIGTDTDISAVKAAEQQRLELSRRLELALQVSQVGVFEADLDKDTTYWDDRLHDLYGVRRDKQPVKASDWEDRLHPDDADAARAVMAEAARTRSKFSTRFRIILQSGEVRTVASQGTYFEDKYEKPKLIGVNWDITEDVALAEGLKAARDLAEARNVELEAARARIEDQSLHDALTGLPNRRYLDDILTRHAHAPLGAKGLALLHIDLDRFKQINDTLGHVAGDAMLVHVAGLLRDNAGDGNFVARVGGDEFIVVCINETNTERLAALAGRIIRKIRQPVAYEGHFCRFGASIGIAVEDDATIDPQRVLINGDIALYRAKGRGRNRFEFFSKALQDEIESTKRLADDILRGIEQREFLPFYQPLVDATTRQVAGVEALVRWIHPTEGVISPIRFLKTAEDLDVLGSIDRLMLEQALGDLELWSGLGLGIPSVSVNVSFRRLADDQLLPSLRQLKIRPGTVSFEFVESIFLDEFDDVLAWNIDAIRDLGIGIDFGTGHTSIVSLLKLNPQRFKIDRQLIEPLTRIPGQRRLVASIIDIGKTLGIKVVAEGVETLEHADILRDLGCDLLQGYAFAKPMSSAALVDFIGVTSGRRAS